MEPMGVLGIPNAWSMSKYVQNMNKYALNGMNLANASFGLMENAFLGLVENAFLGMNIVPVLVTIVQHGMGIIQPAQPEAVLGELAVITQLFAAYLIAMSPHAVLMGVLGIQNPYVAKQLMNQKH